MRTRALEAVEIAARALVAAVAVVTFGAELLLRALGRRIA